MERGPDLRKGATSEVTSVEAVRALHSKLSADIAAAARGKIRPEAVRTFSRREGQSLGERANEFAAAREPEELVGFAEKRMNRLVGFAGIGPALLDDFKQRLTEFSADPKRFPRASVEAWVRSTLAEFEENAEDLALEGHPKNLVANIRQAIDDAHTFVRKSGYQTTLH